MNLLANIRATLCPVMLLLAACILAPLGLLAQIPAALCETADSLYEAGAISESCGLYRQCLDLADANADVKPKTTVQALFGVGRCLLRGGDFAAADSAFSRALAICKDNKDNSSPELAKCLLGLASVYKNISRFNDAEKLIRKAIAIRQKFYGNIHIEVAFAQNNLANLFKESERNFAETEDLYNKAINVLENAPLTDRKVASSLASTRNNLAAILHSQGRFLEAKAEYQRALDATLQLAKPDNVVIAQILKNLAEIDHDIGLHEKAEPQYQQALAIAIETHGLWHTNVAATLSDYARLLNDMQRPAEAETLALQALQIADSLWPDSSTSLAECRKTLGDVYQLQGRFAEAQALYQQAAAIEALPANSNRTFAAKILNSQAILATAQQNYTLAAALEKEAYLKRRAALNKHFGRLTENAALDYSVFLQREAANYLTILLDTPGGEDINREEIARVVFSTKGLVTDGLFVRNRFERQIVTLSQAITDAKNEEARRNVSNDENLAEIRDKIYELEFEKATIEDKFRTEAIITQIDAKRVAEALPPVSALVEYMRYNHQTSLVTWEPRYLAVLVKSNAKTQAYDLGPAALIDSAIVAYRRNITNFRNPNLDEYYELSYELYKKIWLPFESDVRGLNVVLVCPDDALSLVSFAGLRSSEGNYLIENYPLHYIISGRDLVRDPVYTEPGEGLLAIGDPDYDATPAARSSRASSNSMSTVPGESRGLLRSGPAGCQAVYDLNVPRISETRGEVEHVAALWKQALRGTAETYFDAAASEDVFKQHAPGKRVIHLATHGFYIAGECAPSTSGDHAGVENPHLLSGLFFAGSNLAGPDAEQSELQDGILFTQEAGALNLIGTDLVVLSACETGQGEVRAGEGVIGLRRAFQMAGARTVISALWPVDDKSTADLMSAIFSESDPDLAHTMQQAAISILQSRRAQNLSDHPFFWAAFIATGEWNATH